VQATEELY